MSDFVMEDDTTKYADATPEMEALMKQVIAGLRACYDPEIPVNIYDLGLVYEVNIDEDHLVSITMTLTSPACPVAGTLPGEVESIVRSVPGVQDASVEVVWDPSWNPSFMSDEAKLELGMF